MLMSASAHDLFQELYRSAQSIVLSTHIQPDGDALGSQQSLLRFLLDEGKQVRIVNHDPTPQVLSFVEDRSQVAAELFDPLQHEAALREADLIILVDNSAPDRLGRMEELMRSCAERVLCIDHHPARDAPWRHNIVDVGYCATAALIYELTRACGWTPDLNSARAMYVGLATDTGFFRFNSTNARAHRIVAELLDLGVEPAPAYQAVYERNTEAFTRLLGHALAGLQLDAGGAVVSVTITRKLVRLLQAEEVDTSEILTALLAMDGVMVAALYRELDDDRVKVSLRSKGDLDVHRLASEYGGGGHRNASGIVLPGPLEAVARTVTDRASALLATAQTG
jgi:phosphoesterase RecJ-like protein